jgi:hypothetical protein
VVFIDETGNHLETLRPFLRAASPLDLSLLKPGDWYIPQQSSFFSGRAMERVGRCLREPLHYTMDRELMYRLCRQGPVALMDEPLAADRKHSGSKRVAYTLKLYQEDADAIRYCDWGTPQDAARRRWVARQRMAQGYTYAARSAASRWEALRSLALAAWYRPAYLRSRGFYKNLARLVAARQPGEK